MIITAVQQVDAPPSSQSALAELCKIYWPPVYGFIRSRGRSVHDAQDLTQGFFCHLIENQLYTHADPVRGKFRAFLLTSVKHFLANASKYARTLKRGGGYEFLPLCEHQIQAAEAFFLDSSAPGADFAADRTFERQWAEALVETVLAGLAAEFEDEGRGNLFREMRIFLEGGAELPPSHEELGARLQMRSSAVRTQVRRLRARYRERLRTELRRTVENEEQVDGELHALLRVLIAGG